LTHSGYAYALVHIKTKGTKSKESRGGYKISTVKHSTTNFEVGHTIAKSTVALKMLVEFHYLLKLNVMKCIFVVIMSWYSWLQFFIDAFCGNYMC